MGASSNIKFTFNRNKDPDLLYRPKPVEYTLYQICQFPNQTNNKYGVRRLMINEFHEIINSKEKYYRKKKIDKFIQKTPENKYVIYPTHNITMVALPSPDKIMNANSDLLK